MTELRVIIIGLFVTAILVFFLSKLNYKKKDRYKQLWAPIVAILFAIVVLRFDLLHALPVMDSIYDRFPDLEFYSALVFNVVLILIFMIIKLVLRVADGIIRWFGSFFQRKLSFIGRIINWFISKCVRLLPRQWRYDLISKGSKKDKNIAFFYVKNHRDITLDPVWYYPSLMVRYGSFIALFLFLTYVIVLPLDMRGQFMDFLPTYPAVSLIIFLEIAWFLGGLTPIYRAGTISGEDATSKVLANNSNLFEKYKKVWPEKLIASGAMVSTPMETMERREDEYNFFKTADSVVEEQLQIILKRLRDGEIPLRDSYIRMSRVMLDGKNILVTDPLYGEMKPYIFPAIVSRLVNHHRIILVLKDRNAFAKTEKWLLDGFHDANGLEHLWSIATLEKAIQDNTTPHLLLLDVHQLQEKRTMEFLRENFNGANYDTFLFPEAERLLAHESPRINRFVLRLKDLLNTEPVFWIFSQWYDGMKTNVNQTFKIKPVEVIGKGSHSPNLHYMVWKLEGKETIQEKISGSLPYISSEVALSMLAQKFNIGAMQFVNQESLPVVESMEAILKDKNHLLKFGLTERQIRRINENVFVYDQYWQVPQSEHAFMLVRDVNYNLIDTLQHWWTNGRKSSFIHVVSPPYLLRDYICADLSYHMLNNRTISPLSSKQPGTPLGKLKPLLDRLMNGYVYEKDVMEMLPSVNRNLPVLEQLHRAFTDILGAEETVREAIKMEKNRVYDGKNRQFYDAVYYNITEKLSSLFPVKETKVLKVRKQSEEIIDYIMEGHVSQRYLLGQEHAFQGELYRIKKISPESGYIDVVYVPQKRNHVYKQDRYYSLDLTKVRSKHDNDTRHLSDISFEFSLLETPFYVETKGYCLFEKSVDIRPGANAYSYIELREGSEGKQAAERSYETAKVLKVNITVGEGKRTYSEKTAFTIAFLLNEMFVTLFPHSHSFLAATTELSDDFFNEKSQEQMALKKLHHAVTVSGGDDFQGRLERKEATYSFYIFEDSPTQLGLVESIQNQWEDIVNILDDYLTWVVEDIEVNGEYLRFGKDAISPVFDLEGAQELVRSMLYGQTIQKRRNGVGLKEAKEATDEVASSEEEKRQCSFCREEYVAVQYEVLDDGRVRCRECSDSSVDTESELKPIYQHCREFLAENYGIELRHDIDLSIVSAETLHKTSGLPFVPANPSRMVGKASINENKDISVVVENGSPKLQTYATLVHELTHVWQFDNLNYRLMTLEELEGFATWVEIKLAEHFGERVYVEKFIMELRQRNDVYSRGYFELLETLKTSWATNPFELFGGRDE